MLKNNKPSWCLKQNLRYFHSHHRIYFASLFACFQVAEIWTIDNLEDEVMERSVFRFSVPSWVALWGIVHEISLSEAKPHKKNLKKDQKLCLRLDQRD